MKCKVISTSKHKLENEVNKWLSTGKYEITNVTQTEHSTLGVTLTIFYYDSKELRKKKLEKLDNYELD